MVGWSSLLDYLFLPMINVLLAKIYLSALFPEVPPWVWVVTFVAILTAANLKSVNLVANFNTLFVLVQISIMVVFIFLVVQGLHQGEGVGTVWSLLAVYQRERAPGPDYSGGGDCLFLLPRFGCGDHAFGRDAGRRTRDPESHLPDGGLRWRYLYRCVVLYAAVLSRYQPL